MRNITSFKPNKQIPLKHKGECTILGVSSAGNIYAEEFYDNTFIAQYEINPLGEILNSVDENFGKNTIKPLEIPDDTTVPNTLPDHPLNYKGLRYRGLREEEKIMEWVQPLPLPSKIPLIKALNLTVSPMMIFGIAESRVLSQTVLDTTQLICRRIRLLRALPEIQHGDDALPYDYDTITFSVLHPYNTETGDYPLLHEAIQNRPELHYPQDCLSIGNSLIVSDNGNGEKLSRIHIFKQDENNI